MATWERQLRGLQAPARPKFELPGNAIKDINFMGLACCVYDLAATCRM